MVTPVPLVIIALPPRSQKLPVLLVPTNPTWEHLRRLTVYLVGSIVSLPLQDPQCAPSVLLPLAPVISPAPHSVLVWASIVSTKLAISLACVSRATSTFSKMVPLAPATAFWTARRLFTAAVALVKPSTTAATV